jgi:hypothetical protein
MMECMSSELGAEENLDAEIAEDMILVSAAL